MMTFRSRLWRNLAILICACLLIALVYTLLAVSLKPTSFYTGWGLFGLMVVLASYNVFKKLPFLPLGTSSTWLQFHIYCGYATVLLFALHLGPRLPHKPLGIIMMALYVGVAGSGILGLALSRWVPPRLRAAGEEVLYERIPIQQRALQKEVEELVLRSVQVADSTSISDFYVKRLKGFFDSPRNFWGHLLFSNLARRRALLAEAQDQKRYMNEQEREIMEAVIDHIRAKDDLDYQYALQGVLKFWLFVHIPLTYSLLIFSLFHVLMVYTFSGVIQ
jgi:hypothetical protein